MVCKDPNRTDSNFLKSLSLFEANAVIICLEIASYRVKKSDYKSREQLSKLKDKLIQFRYRGWATPLDMDPRERVRIAGLIDCKVNTK